ncbi:MAG: OsmC family protein [Thermoplasmata archaeon]
MDDVTTFDIDIKHIENMKFEVSFDHEEMGTLITDETPDIGGENAGPTPGRLLVASTLNCLMASLLFCVNKKRVEMTDLQGEIRGTVERVEGRWRVTKMDAVLRPEVEDPEKIQKCIEIFQNYCIVTESVRNGIDVDVKVEI